MCDSFHAANYLQQTGRKNLGAQTFLLSKIYLFWEASVLTYAESPFVYKTCWWINNDANKIQFPSDLFSSHQEIGYLWWVQTCRK